MLFSQIIGHEDIKKKLIQSVKENRIAHAQLFLGPEGTGKLALAIAYAQYVNCTNKGENDSCGECPSCKKFNNLAHPDLHFIFPSTTNKNVKKDPESDFFLTEWREYLESCECYANISSWHNALDAENKQGIINVRDASTIIRKLNLKTYESEYKVAIIWMAERLNIEAANKLLKLLEEPPENVIFILATTEEHKILPTILSRCIRFEFKKIGKAGIVKRLEHVLKDYDVRYDIEALEHIAELADGGMRDALSILERCITSGEGEITEQKIEEIIGTVPKKLIHDIVISVLEYNITKVEELVNTILSSGKDLRNISASITQEFLKVLNDCLTILDNQNISYVV